MVRRTSKENKKIKDDIIKYKQWLTENENARARAREHAHFHALDHGFVPPKIITGICSICKQVLTADYPDDHPDEFKFCCSCLGWAGSIINNKDDEWLIYALAVSPTVRKVYARITVFGK